MDQNKDSVPKRNKLQNNHMLEGLDEIEDFEDLEDSGKGFHFFGGNNALRLSKVVIWGSKMRIVKPQKKNSALEA